MTDCLKWPAAFDGLDRLVTPATAQPNQEYHYQLGPHRVPLILRGGGGSANVNEKKRRSCTAHFAVKASFNHSELSEWLAKSNLSSWHLLWQTFAQPQYREIVCNPCRADIKTPEGRVIEVQRSRISREDVHLRNQTHKSVTWILDAHTAALTHHHSLPETNQLMRIQLSHFPAAQVFYSRQFARPDTHPKAAESANAGQPFLERFRFGKHSTKIVTSKAENPEKVAESSVRIYLDVGMSAEVLEVVGPAEERGDGWLCWVRLVAIEQMLEREFGKSLQPEAIVKELIGGRGDVFSRHQTSIHLLEEARRANEAEFLKRIHDLKTHNSILESQIVEARKVSAEGVELRKVARLCTQCAEPFPLLRAANDKLCACCEMKKASRFDERQDMDCYRCGQPVPLAKIQQEPHSGRFFCNACARPCHTNHCRHFAHNASKLCTHCATRK